MSGWILAIGAVDERLLRALASRRRPGLSRFMRFYTHLGDPPVPVAVALLLLLGPAPGPEGLRAHSAASLALAFFLSQLLKRAISRPRPRLPVGLRSLVRAPDRFSFPSGHATASLAVALPVAMGLGGGLLTVLALIPALLVGISRCYLGVHYPGDVVMGWGLGLFSALLTGALLG